MHCAMIVRKVSAYTHDAIITGTYAINPSTIDVPIPNLERSLDSSSDFAFTSLPNTYTSINAADRHMQPHKPKIQYDRNPKPEEIFTVPSATEGISSPEGNV